jgi:hypothetical protein
MTERNPKKALLTMLLFIVFASKQALGKASFGIRTGWNTAYIPNTNG